MNAHSNTGGENRGPDDLIDEEPESKRGDEGESAHGGDQAGPNSDRAGEPIAPQTGDPADRRPN